MCLWIKTFKKPLRNGGIKNPEKNPPLRNGGKKTFKKKPPLRNLPYRPCLSGHANQLIIRNKIKKGHNMVCWHKTKTDSVRSCGAMGNFKLCISIFVYRQINMLVPKG